MASSQSRKCEAVAEHGTGVCRGQWTARIADAVRFAAVYHGDWYSDVIMTDTT